jgi:hypothetical protein
MLGLWISDWISLWISCADPADKLGIVRGKPVDYFFKAGLRKGG